MKNGVMGSNAGGNEWFKLAVQASTNCVADATGITQFDVDSLELFAINYILKSWDPEDLAAYTDRMRAVTASEAGRSRPLLCNSIFLSLDWLPHLISGEVEPYAAACWKMTKAILDMNDESSDVYSLLTEEDRTKGKTILTYILNHGGDAIQTVPGFSWNCFGRNGDVLVDCQNAFVFEEHHTFVVAAMSADVHMCYGSGPFIIALQFGRVKESLTMLEQHLVWTEKIVANPSTAGYKFTILFSSWGLAAVFQMHGMSQHVQKMYTALGFTFDNASDRLVETADGLGMFSAMEHRETGPHLFGLKRCLWQIKSMCVLNTNVPEVEAVAWLTSLPDDDTFIAFSLNKPTHDVGAMHGPSKKRSIY